MAHTVVDDAPSQSWCPLDETWHPDYFNNAEEHYQSIKATLSQDLLKSADDVITHFEQLLSYHWDSEPDAINYALTVTQSGKKYCYVLWEGEEDPTERELQLIHSLDWTPALTGKNKGVAAWYRGLLKNCSIGSKLAPIIMGFTWKGSLLYYNDSVGYHTCDNKGNVTKVSNPDKRGKPVHSMLMKGFKDDARLSAITPISEGILKRFILR
jgi:hypothetical protein